MSSWTNLSGSAASISTATSDGARCLSIGAGGVIRQDLSHVLTGGETLTLRYDSYRGGASYTRTIKLVAKNGETYTTLCERTDTVGDGTWPTAALDYVVEPAHVGSELAIEITGVAGYCWLDHFRMYSSPPDSPRIVGYLPHYRSLIPDQLDSLTHVIAFNVIPDPLTGTFKVFSEVGGVTTYESATGAAGLTSTDIEQIVAACASRGVKASVCIGGGDIYAEFQGLAINGMIDTFAAYVRDMALAYGLDGIDIDWEHPNTSEDPDRAEQLFAALEQELSPHGIELTAAWTGYAGATYALEAVRRCRPYTDAVYVMSYGNTLSSFQERFDLYAQSESAGGQGYSATKVCPGVPFFGRSADRSVVKPYAQIVALSGGSIDPALDVYNFEGKDLLYVGQNTMQSINGFSADAGCGMMIWEVGQDVEFSHTNSLLGALSWAIDPSPSVAGLGYAEVWGMDDNRQFQFSTNGTSLGATFDTNHNGIAQINDDGTFIFAPNSGNGNDTILLSTPIVLTNGATSKVKLSYDLSSVDFSVDPSTQTILDVILMDSVSSDSVTIRLLDVDTSDTLRGQVYLREEGTPPNLFLGNQTAQPVLSTNVSTVISVELDYSAGGYAWDINGATGSGAVDLAGLGIDRFDSIKIVYNNWSNSTDKAVFDHLMVETFMTQPESIYIVEYQMNDVATTALSSVDQTGNDPGSFPALTGIDAATDGLGNVLFRDVTASKGPTMSLADVYSNGVYTIDLYISEWDQTAENHGNLIRASVQSSLTDGESMMIGLGVDSNYNGMVVSSWVAPGTYVSGSTINEIPYQSNGTGIVMRLQFDLDDGSYRASWKWDTDASFTQYDSGASMNLVNYNQFKLNINTAGSWPADQSMSIGYMTLNQEPQITVESGYSLWLDNYPGLGAATNLTDNADGDALDNLAEYALGGNPVDAADVGVASVSAIMEEGGVNYLEYVHPVRYDADIRGLTYYLESDEDLVNAPGWVGVVYEVIGTNFNFGAAGFNSVTNRISIDAKVQQFLRLRVGAAGL
ncbi:hypothetical protein SCARR_02862 [Pontiella sulfatireligans]|uniref:chitinase n=2 Tax=Pontiella sulfatireligans TaxID=2750658 RepID=A0A6C2UKN5_9BACT|nr:hypothetical protein SCARR_02862 [Pontiella sulfatireligans]